MTPTLSRAATFLAASVLALSQLILPIEFSPDSAAVGLSEAAAQGNSGNAGGQGGGRGKLAGRR